MRLSWTSGKNLPKVRLWQRQFEKGVGMKISRAAFNCSFK